MNQYYLLILWLSSLRDDEDQRIQSDDEDDDHLDGLHVRLTSQDDDDIPEQLLFYISFQTIQEINKSKKKEFV